VTHGPHVEALSSHTYQEAGVDIEAKADLLAGLTPAITATHTEAVVAGMGAFAGAMRLGRADAGLLMATTDGVGTKTLVARALGRDDVIGADIVAHCANDLVAGGGRPLAFLDYIAMGRLDPSVVRALVESMVGACRGLGVAMLGGETAEMPDVYAGVAYDVVGTMIGLAPPDGLVNGQTVRPGHRIIGLASTGLHTNGYTLARRIVAQAGVALGEYVPDLGTTAGDALLQPHRCYAAAVLALFARLRVHAIAHITGGGLVGNIVRVLPEGCRATLTRTWPQPPVFAWLQHLGRVPAAEMERTFNLGIGMAIVVAAPDAGAALRHCDEQGVPAFEIGEVARGVRGVDLR
jgi:phosphoribosylformylglycinamidine cyclo-ligase